MNELPAKLRQRNARKRAKREEKKLQIASSALEALKELGYANTSLRDIAAKSDLSLGMLHYYFEDRSDLIIFCVRTYKDEFVRRFSEALDRAEGREQVIAAFSGELVAAIVDDEMIHKLWYDIRNQAMFDDTFRPVADEIEAMLIGIVRKAYRRLDREIPDDIDLLYAMLDGVFRYLMQRQMGPDPVSREQLRRIFERILSQFL